MNNLANLVKRTHTLIFKVFSGRLTVEEIGELDPECLELLTKSKFRLNKILESYIERDIHSVTKESNTLLSELNSFFHHRAPGLFEKINQK